VRELRHVPAQVKRLDEVAIDRVRLQDDVAFAIRMNAPVITTLSAQIEANSDQRIG
jgi:hypothetical protein